MADLTRRATTLIKEMLTADGKLPAYNEEIVRQTLQQISSHQEGIKQMLSEVNEVRHQQGENTEEAVDWAQSAEHAGAVVVHHETILKLKRILLTYIKLRADCLVKVRWQQRHVPPDVKENMSPQESNFYTSYDTALRQYMAGFDLTLDMTPPKDVNVRVMVLKDGGSRALSHSLNVPLIPGSVHNLKCSDAEQLVRQGVLQVLDSNT